MTASRLRATRNALRLVSILACAGLAPALIALAAEKADVGNLVPQDIAVTAHPITFSTKQPDQRQFGKLTLLGEVVLTSGSDYFGGYSGLVLDAKGERFLTISDSGSWLTGRLDYSDGKVTAVRDARIGAIPQENGQPLKRNDRDAEALVSLVPGALEGHYLIGFEQRHRIDEYAYENGQMQGPVAKRPLPEQLKGMEPNLGIEGVTILRGGPFAGGMVAFAEEKLTADGNHTGALVTGGKSQPLFMKRHEEFDITDVQSLVDGSLVVLERSFNEQTRRLGIRLRRIPAAEVKPGAVLAGETLLEAGPEFEIDNFEGLAVHKSAAGETILTLISDDNFSAFQRTLLLQFKLQ
jgi:hypothetical protein